MPRLTGSQTEQLLDAILDAFDRNSFEELLQFNLEKRLDLIVARDDNLRDDVRTVIEAANREGWITPLLRAIAETRADLEPLRQTVAALLATAAPAPPSPDRLPAAGTLPAGSRLPYPRNAAFTGRRDDLLAVAARLMPGTGADESNLVAPLILTGQGGSGKTQLAVEFCYRYGRWFEGVHWIAGVAGFDPELVECGRVMGVHPWPDAQPDQAAATLRAWGNDPARLVVLDGVEEPAALRTWLARLGPVRVLVTSRNDAWPEDLGVAVHALPLLAPQEGRDLLRALAPRLGDTPDAALDPLATRLAGLPLALDLAGRYLKDNPDLALDDYLAELNSSSALEHESLDDWTEYSPTTHAGLPDTFAASLQRLDQDTRDGPSANRLFRACGYCAPSVPIPRELLRAVDGGEGGASRRANRALMLLARLGLISMRRDADPSIHALLAEYARQLDRAAGESALAALGKALEAVTPSTKLLTGQGDSATVTALELPADAAPYQPPPETAAISTEYPAPYRAHLETAATWTEAAGRTVEASRLWSVLGSHLSDVVAFEAARNAHARALALAETALEPNDPIISVRLNDLALVLELQGDYADARALLERALNIEEAAPQPNPVEIATRLVNLGALLRDLGEFAGARELQARALALIETVYDPDDARIAAYLNSLALTRRDLDELEPARADLERALRITEAHAGPNHPDTAIHLLNLGMVLEDLNRWEEAEAHYTRALAIDERAFGPDHLTLANDLDCLGRALQHRKDYATAQSLYERALRITETALGPDHPDVANWLNNLATVLYLHGDREAARAALERALRILQRDLPPDHPHIRSVTQNMAFMQS